MASASASASASAPAVPDQPAPNPVVGKPLVGRPPAANPPATGAPATGGLATGAPATGGTAAAVPDAPAGPGTAPMPELPRELPRAAAVAARPGGGGGGGGMSLSGARSELRRQLREQKRVRTMAMAVVVVTLLGAPMLYFGILFATRDPALNSLDRLAVPEWAARSPEDRIISGSRWCFIDCRLRDRTLVSERGVAETTQAYQTALVDAGWTRWEVGGCPLAEVDGDYTCWTRDEYTLDLWVRPPECAYDPLNLRPDLIEEDEAEGAEGEDGDPEGDADPEAAGQEGEEGATEQECSGSVVEVKMQNRVADLRGQPGVDGGVPGGEPTGDPSGDPQTPDPDGTGPPPSDAAADTG